MKKKKKKKAVSGDYITLSMDGDVIAEGRSDTFTATMSSTPTMSDDDYYKYTDMLYKAWSALNKAGYKVNINME